ncbi:tRNA(His) guanylyltransferase Thg1 family protein [Marininema halotolerans]|uniref:tRNA(His) 5'-end guanylyltransferase n=1 Tax=Marininema halotolerans TaxID=1155944 RepID=A0A1I6NRT8_9BACL|nr:tRNA(His) guanylyltransferase Thg1 family protein [Marininema halotolerans]SFS30581.1 tRNA(His) 5'-end guanylyltransferase [Marininema halotolerans]
MNKHDDFGERMKEYEFASRTHLPRRLPVLIRIDGCHFHSFTRGMDKPFDFGLIQSFWETCCYLGQMIMGCQLIYHQSDEISLLVTNDHKLSTESWFKNNVQKIVSVSASLATAKFNEAIKKHHPKTPLATFDSRAWVLPSDEVANYFIWRQQDATKNSISMLAQTQFTQSELTGLNQSNLQDKLLIEKEINWNDLPIWQKRGICIRRVSYQKGNAERTRWEVDHETPIFSKEREYIHQFISKNPTN